uniref:Uncharacterized protein n=1 Tax=Rhizophora mucronata TaxID=61149 RepID=A0A2P2IKU4_RHIMU
MSLMRKVEVSYCLQQGSAKKWPTCYYKTSPPCSWTDKTGEWLWEKQISV